MAKVKIQGNASGTGVLTVTAPNTSTDRTITLPDSTGTLLTSDGDGSSLTGVGVAGISSSANATAITIDSSENVGIGVTPESHNASWTGVDIAGVGNLTGETATSAGNQFTINNNAYLNTSGNWVYKQSSDEACQLQTFDGKFRFRTAPTGTADSNVTFTERLLITNDGRGLSSFTAKAWCRFDGGGTPSFSDSFNCSSLGDWATGNYGIYMTNGVGNGNYAVLCLVNDAKYGSLDTSNTAPQGGRFDIEVRTVDSNFSAEDVGYVSCLVFGD